MWGPSWRQFWFLEGSKVLKIVDLFSCYQNVRIVLSFQYCNSIPSLHMFRYVIPFQKIHILRVSFLHHSTTMTISSLVQVCQTLKYSTCRIKCKCCLFISSIIIPWYEDKSWFHLHSTMTSHRIWWLWPFQKCSILVELRGIWTGMIVEVTDFACSEAQSIIGSCTCVITGAPYTTSLLLIEHSSMCSHCCESYQYFLRSVTLMKDATDMKDIDLHSRAWWSG